jgi:hypothetical protein
LEELQLAETKHKIQVIKKIPESEFFLFLSPYSSSAEHRRSDLKQFNQNLLEYLKENGVFVKVEDNFLQVRFLYFSRNSSCSNAGCN